MRLPDDSTIYVRAWTEQICAACGAKFQYVRRFVVQRHDLNFNATIATVEADYRRHALDTAELCPCPHCGALQPDMIAGAKAVSIGTATFIGFLALLINGLAAGFDLLPRAACCGIAVGFVAGFLVYDLYQLLLDMNRDLALNLAWAKRRLDEGSLQLLQPGGNVNAPALPIPLRPAVIAAGLMLGSAVAFLSPLLLDWPLWPGQVPGLMLFIVAGVMIANLGFDLKRRAHAHKLAQVNCTVVEDESVPEDFRKKK
jgi:hypothetical protein